MRWKKNKNQTIYSFTLKYLEVKKFIQTFSKNFKKSCLSFNFPLCNIWKNHLFILRIALSLFLCQAALMCITLFRTLPTAATRWLASRLTKVWVLAFFSGWCGLMIGGRTSYCKYSVTFHKRINAHNIYIYIHINSYVHTHVYIHCIHIDKRLCVSVMCFWYKVQVMNKHANHWIYVTNYIYMHFPRPLGKRGHITFPKYVICGGLLPKRTKTAKEECSIGAR